jgi:hypothetical protein
VALAITETAELSLPGGLLDPSGQCHRRGWLRPLTGADEDWLYSLAPSTRQAEVITALLERCVTRIGPYPITADTIRDLSVGDRDYLVLKLREATFGPKLSRVLTCPHPGCGARMDLDLLVDDFAIDEQPALPSHRLRVDAEDGVAVELEFRVPRGREQELIAAQPTTSLEVNRERLLGCCVIRAAMDGGRELSFDALSSGVKQALADAIEAAAPGVELDLELVCPDCSQPFDFALDPASLLLGEIGASRAVFDRELHLLAFYYHWSPGDLLALTRPRRQQFLRLLTEELGAMTGRS